MKQWWEIAIHENVVKLNIFAPGFFPSRRFFKKFRVRAFRGCFLVDRFFVSNRDGLKPLYYFWEHEDYFT